jgi:hypothetical protein
MKLDTVCESTASYNCRGELVNTLEQYDTCSIGRDVLLRNQCQYSNLEGLRGASSALLIKQSVAELKYGEERVL